MSRPLYYTFPLYSWFVSHVRPDCYDMHDLVSVPRCSVSYRLWISFLDPLGGKSRLSSLSVPLSTMADRTTGQPVSDSKPQLPDGQLRALRERYPTMVHFIMASVILTPLALAPYLPIRSRLVRLGRDIRAGNQAIAALRQELATVNREQDVIGLRQQVDSLRAELEGSRRHLANATTDLVETQRHLHALVVSTAQLEATVKSSAAQLDGVRSRE